MRLNTERPAFERAAIQKDGDELQEWGEQEKLKFWTRQMVLV